MITVTYYSFFKYDEFGNNEIIFKKDWLKEREILLLDIHRNKILNEI